MAGLSSIMAITRPLGEVDLAAMNRCTGVYRVYLIGGGGGGGGFQDWYEWYGGAGENGEHRMFDVLMVPPITLSAGYGGYAGVDATDTGGWGGDTTMNDLRSSGHAGNLITAAGGAGGESANIRRLIQMEYPTSSIGKETDRFTVMIDHPYYQNPPTFLVVVGTGGRSTLMGDRGGIIKAFRIG